MILGRRRLGGILLVVAAIMFGLMLLSTTTSGAQTGAGDNVATAGDECVDFEDGDGGTGTSEDTGTNTNGNAGAADTSGDTGDQQALQDGNQESQTGTTSQDTGTNTSEDPGNTDASEGAPTDTGTGDTGNTDANTSTDAGGETGTDTGASEDTGSDTGTGTTSGDAGTGTDEECVIADTVPDEQLPPTGAPVKSRADEKAAKKDTKSDRGEEQKKSDRGEKPESSSEKKKKTDSGKKQEARGGKQTKSGSAEKQTDRGKKLEIKDRGKKLEIEDRSGLAARQEKPGTRSESANSTPASTPDLAPVLAATEWTRPSREEVASTDKPRRFAPNPNAEMTLSARALGLYDVPVAGSNRREDLDNGLVRVPETSLPWDGGDQRNVYIAGHYLGHPESASRLAFYNLHKLGKDDEMVLKDGLGRTHKYRVSEKFAVGPEDSWVMGQVRNQDMLTLQTCIPPDFGKRLIVRAKRV